MIDLKINQELINFSSFNGIDEAFLPIFISKYLKLNNKSYTKDHGRMPGPSLRMRDADSFLRQFWLNNSAL